jgi:hypothetical protein
LGFVLDLDTTLRGYDTAGEPVATRLPNGS